MKSFASSGALIGLFVALMVVPNVESLARTETLQWSELIKGSEMVLSGGVVAARVLSDWDKKGVRLIELRIIPYDVYSRSAIGDFDGTIEIMVDSFESRVPVGSSGLFFLNRNGEAWRVIDRDLGQWEWVSRSCKGRNGYGKGIFDSYSLGPYSPHLMNIDPEILRPAINCNRDQGLVVQEHPDGIMSLEMIDQNKLKSFLRQTFGHYQTAGSFGRSEF
jgi:hypothetical protein